jgi:hypothetical protein
MVPCDEYLTSTVREEARRSSRPLPAPILAAAHVHPGSPRLPLQKETTSRSKMGATKSKKSTKSTKSTTMEFGILVERCLRRLKKHREMIEYPRSSMANPDDTGGNQDRTADELQRYENESRHETLGSLRSFMLFVPFMVT